MKQITGFHCFSKMLHSQGTLFGLKKFHLAPPNFEGDESYGVSVAIFGPGCFTGNSKTNIHIPFVKTTRPVLNHLHKGHRSCYEKSTNPELSHCFLELSTVESPGIRDSVRILGGVTVFNHFKELQPQKKAKFAQNCQVPHLLSDLKKVCSNS